MSVFSGWDPAAVIIAYVCVASLALLVIYRWTR